LRISRSVLTGEIEAVPSKSYTHRALILGALSGSRFEVRKPLVSDDTAATLSALSMMGTSIMKMHDSIAVNCPKLSSPEKTINVWNSGTTLRLISGVAALMSDEIKISGDESLRRRPMKPLLDALRSLGADCTGTGSEEHPPVTIKGPMTEAKTRLPGDVSSQFISSLLISCPMKDSETEIEIVGAQKSKPYVEMTLFLIQKLGIEIQRRPNGFWISGGQKPSGSGFEVPGDFSSASFQLAAAAITDGEIAIRGLDVSIPQADTAVLKALEQFGASVKAGENSVSCAAGESAPFEFDVSQSPDLFPILGVIAAIAKGESRLFGGEHLRFKESDRISTTVMMLRSIGVDAEERDDGCIIRGSGKIRGGRVDTQGDHRIMMSAVVAGLASDEGVMLEDNSSYRISYPQFLEEIRSLGGNTEEVVE